MKYRMRELKLRFKEALIRLRCSLGIHHWSLEQLWAYKHADGHIDYFDNPVEGFSFTCYMRVCEDCDELNRYDWRGHTHT